MSIVRLALGAVCALLCVTCFGGSGEADDNAGPTGGVGGGVGGGEISVPLLESLACEELVGEYDVASMHCYFHSSSVDVTALRQSDASARSNHLVSASFDSLTPGVLETDYGGSMTFPGPRGDSSVDLGICGSYVSSSYSESPCELELQEIRRGTLETIEVEGELTPVEVGSFVRMRVSCPDGLVSPGYGTDVGPSVRTLIPSEFLLEASDCTVFVPEPDPENVPEPE